MRVLIVNNMAPFVWGGAEELAANLARVVTEHGHSVDVARIPFQWEPADRIPSQMLLARFFEMSNTDHVIALKFPAYLVRHPRKTIWLLHQYRQAYDLFEAGQSNIPSDETGDRLRHLIRNADDQNFDECRHLYTNSETTRQRLRRFNNRDAIVLPPPVNDPERFVGGTPQPYIFVGGRVNSMKRQLLAVEALSLADASVRLVIAGPPDTPSDAVEVRQLAERLDVVDRITFDLRLMSRDEYAGYVNAAAAVAYLPYDEDSLGYVTMEAATARKALITTTDSGGVTALVRTGETGWLVEPAAAALADAFSAAIRDLGRVVELGQGAADLWRSMGITWDDTIEALLK
jgi:glycosyltransferase involved in cell wall biosynthesis